MILAVLSIAQFLIALDYSIIYIALPSVAADLDLEPATAQWVVSAYAVLFAGFLVVGGRLSDRVGAGRMFTVAIVAFGVASAVGGIAGDGATLLAARGAQGLAAALMQPAILGLIGSTFAAGARRGAALAVWSAVGAAGLAAGAILGGVLTTASWRLTFFINVPLTLACALAALRWFTAARPTGTERIPVRAAVLGTAAVLSLVLGLTLGADRGWRDPATLVTVGLAAALLVAFVHTERTARAVLIEPALRATASLRTGAAATALYMASVGSEFYLLTLLLQQLKGYDPLGAGLAFLPLAVTVTAGNLLAGRALRYLSAPAVLLGGFALATVGLAWLSITLAGTDYAADLLPGLVLSGLGHGVIYTSMFVIGTHDVPDAQQGTSGALLTTSQYLSGAVTLAVLTLVLGPTPGQPDFRAAFLLTTAAAAAGAVLAAVRVRRPERVLSP
jgi:MFS family permease